MQVLNIVKKFINKNILTLVVYIIFIALTYPLESIFMSRLIGKLSQITPNWKQNKKTIVKTIITLCVVWGIIKISYSFVKYLGAILYPKFYLMFRKEFYERLLKKYEKEFKDISIGEVLTNIITIPYEIKELLKQSLKTYIPGIFTILAMTGYFFYKNKYLGMLLLSAPLVTASLYFLLGKKCFNLITLFDIKFDSMAEYVRDKLSNLFSIYVNNNVLSEIKAYENIEEGLLKADRIASNCSNVLSASLSIQQIIYFSAILVLLYYLLKKGKLSTEIVVSCMIMITYFFGEYERLCNSIPWLNNLSSRYIKAEKFLKSLQSKELETKNIKFTKGHILVDNISFAYDRTEPIINNFSMEIKPGENVALYGKSGSGKTTFIKLLLGFYKLNSGTILIDGNNLYDYGLYYLRSQVSYVNQTTKLFKLSVMKNITYGLKVSHEVVYTFIKKHNITIFDSLPNGLSTNVGLDGNKISGGQKQMVLLIKAFLKKAVIYILDEPVKGLDKKTKQETMAIIKKLSKNKTTLIVSHDADIRKIVDRVIDFN